jgi:hypothetical protein
MIEDPLPRRIEITTAVLLSLAGLTSAWASYQAALWGGIQASHYARASAKVTEASRLSIVDGQAVGTDTAMFLAWLNAAADGDAKRMLFFERHFSPELMVLFVPWRAALPEDVRTAAVQDGPPPPLPRSQHAEGKAAKALQKAADAEFIEGDRANDIGDRYVATTVVLSTVLFLGGISPILRRDSMRMAMLLLAALLGAVAAGFIVSFPVAEL